MYAAACHLHIKLTSKSSKELKAQMSSYQQAYRPIGILARSLAATQMLYIALVINLFSQILVRPGPDWPDLFHRLCRCELLLYTTKMNSYVYNNLVQSNFVRF